MVETLYGESKSPKKEETKEKEGFVDHTFKRSTSSIHRSFFRMKGGKSREDEEVDKLFGFTQEGYDMVMTSGALVLIA